MLNKLLKLANRLDKIGYSTVADEIDALAKLAAELTPEKEKELDESVDKYFADPEIQERNRIEREYGLDEDDKFGLETNAWFGYKWSYEGYPREFAEHAKPFKRYHTILIDDNTAAAMIIEDKDENGKWVNIKSYPGPTNDSMYQQVMQFKSNNEVEKEPLSLDLQKLFDAPDVPDEIEVIEDSDKGHGGVKLF